MQHLHSTLAGNLLCGALWHLGVSSCVCLLCCRSLHHLCANDNKPGSSTASGNPQYVKTDASVRTNRGRADQVTPCPYEAQQTLCVASFVDRLLDSDASMFCRACWFTDQAFRSWGWQGVALSPTLSRAASTVCICNSSHRSWPASGTYDSIHDCCRSDDSSF